MIEEFIVKTVGGKAVGRKRLQGKGVIRWLKGKLEGGSQDQSSQNILGNIYKLPCLQGCMDCIPPKYSDAEKYHFCFDCDLYESTLQCLEFFYPKLPSGARLLLHDYWTPDTDLPAAATAPFPGVRKAVTDYFGGDMEGQVVVFPETTHAVITKT